jgi:Right handed beta helix region
MHFRALMRTGAAILFSVSLATVASAQATRTWISGVGDDVNPCSRTAPCKTFAGAISKTQPGGEIDVLDPGGFGAVTITKSITFDGGEGQVGSILVAGSPGIVINAANTDTIYLRNLEIDGVGTGTYGVRVLNAKAVTLEHVSIFNFLGSPGRGVSVELTSASAPTLGMFLNINNCKFFHNAQTHVVVVPAAGQPLVYADISNSHLSYSTANGGVAISEGGKASIHNCEITNNFSSGVYVDGTVVPAQAFVDNSNISFNNIGVVANSAGSSIRLSNTSIFGNFQNGITGAGTLFTFGTNHIDGNGGNNGTGMIAVTPTIPASQK